MQVSGNTVSVINIVIKLDYDKNTVSVINIVIKLDYDGIMLKIWYQLLILWSSWIMMVLC